MHLKKFKGLSANGFHDVYYREWGNCKNPTIVMVHGLTRNSLDFELLADFLKKDYHCIAVDMVGRGQSDRLDNASLYTFPQYCADLTCLINIIAKDDITWIGTSMGGLLGLILASQEKSPIKKLILNDITPYVPGEWFLGVRKKIALRPTFANFERAVNFVKQFYEDFSLKTEEGWNWLTKASVIKNPDGTFDLNYDSKISGVEKMDETLDPRNYDIFLWPFWQKISCPTYLLYGKKSPLVNETLISQMKIGHDLKVLAVEDVGHTPVFYEKTLLEEFKKLCEL